MKKNIIIVAILLIMLTLSFSLIGNTSRDLKTEPFLNKKILSEKILFFTNIERVRKKLQPLILSLGLDKAAKWQANYSLKRESLTHSSTTPSMQDTAQRINYFGDEWKICSEISTINFSRNIADIPFYAKKDSQGEFLDFAESTVYWRNETQMAIAMVKSWMGSPKHRASILNKKFKSVGIGTTKGKYKKEPAWFGFQVFSDKKQSITSGLKIITKEYGALILYKGKFKLGVMLVITNEAKPIVEKKALKLIGTGIYKLAIPKPQKGDIFITLENEKGLIYPVRKLF